MKKLILALILFVSPVYAQTPPVPVLQDGQVFAFDYFINDVQKFGVTRFEVKIDGQFHVDVDPTNGTDVTTTRTYRVAPPSLVSGTHTIEVRACRLLTCSNPLTMAFDAVLIPIPIFNFRIEPALPRPPG